MEAIMTDNRNDPTQNSDAARNQADADSRNCTNPANTSNWNSSAREAYELQWNYNHKKD